MIPHAEILSAVGLIRTSRRRGFCPACRLFQTGDGPQEVSAPALLSVAFVVFAAAAWAVTIARMSSMDDMSMGLGPLDGFAAAWAVMMVAMMFPSATPLVFEFARNTEGRRGWRVATALLGVTYLAVWVAFGIVCYALYNAVGMPWPHQSVVGGVAVVLAGLYALTPLKRASEARCRELCAVHGPLPFNLLRSAMVAGWRYALSCLGCSAGLMVAMVLVGISNVVWMIAFTAVVLIYKLAPAPGASHGRWLALSAALVGVGAIYAAGAY
jgi:predicted metal-binding membrane protein